VNEVHFTNYPSFSYPILNHPYFRYITDKVTIMSTIPLERGSFGIYYNINIHPVFFGVDDGFGNLIPIKGAMWNQLYHFMSN
jgi:hypothetical protein